MSNFLYEKVNDSDLVGSNWMENPVALVIGQLEKYKIRLEQYISFVNKIARFSHLFINESIYKIYIFRNS